MKRNPRRPPPRPRRIAAAILLATLAAGIGSSFGPAHVWAQGRAGVSQIDLNQKRMRVDALLRRVGEAAGETILVPDDVRGTISIVAKRPMSIEEAWAVLESSLSLLGYSLLPSPEGLWRISKVSDCLLYTSDAADE